MSSRRHLTDFEKGLAIGRMEAGQTLTTACEHLKIAKSVMSRIYKRYKKTGNVRRQPGQGRKRATTDSQDRYLATIAKRNRHLTSVQIAKEFAAATGIRLSRFTVSDRLHKRGLYARKPKICVPLTGAAKCARLKWCREHRNWSSTDWSRVLFTDESRFCLESDSRRVTVWREQNTRNNPSNILERHRYKGGGIMVWAGIILNGRTDLHIFSTATMNAEIYRDEVLDPHVKLFRGAVGDNFLLMDDNARPHRADLVNEYLETEGIQRMEWPAYSPDLNPIENMWDALGRRLACRQPPPTTLRELKKAIIHEYTLLPQALLNNLIHSMENRCKACISVKGDHIPY